MGFDRPVDYPSIDLKYDRKIKKFNVVDIIGLTNKYFRHEIYDLPDHSNYKRYDFSQLWENKEIVHKIYEIEELTEHPQLRKYTEKILFCLYKKTNFVLPLGILQKIEINEQSSIINNNIIYTLTFFGDDKLDVLQLDRFEIFLTREDIKKNIRYINMSDSTIYKIGNKPKPNPYDDYEYVLRLPKTLRSAVDYSKKRAKELYNGIKKRYIEEIEAKEKRKEAEINSKEEILEMRMLLNLKEELKLYKINKKNQEEKREKEREKEEKREKEKENEGGNKTGTKQKRNKTGTKQKRNKTRKII